MLLTVTDHPQFYGLEISLSNILTIGSFCSNKRTVIFSKQKKKIHSTANRKGPYIYNIHMEGVLPNGEGY